MRKIIGVAIISIVLLTGTTNLNAQVKSYSIHKSSNVDEVTDSAVDSNKGDIVVAWTESFANGEEQAIWVCFLKRNPNGTYAVRKPVKLTEAGVYGANPTVAYSSVSKSFLVSYGVGLQPVTVYAVIVKRGKIKKTRELWTEPGGSQADTMAAAGLTKKNEIPGKKTAFVIAKGAYAPDVGTPARRVYLFPISKKGDTTGEPILMQESGVSEISYSGGRVSDMQIGGAGTVYIALNWSTFPDGGGSISHTGAIVANPDGSFAGASTLDTNDPQFYARSKVVLSSAKSATVAWRRGDANSVRYKTVTNKGKAQGNASTAFDVDVAWDDFGLVSDMGNTVYFFENNNPGDETLYLIGGNGKVAKTASLKVPPIRTTHYTMAGIPRNNELLLVTNELVSDTKTGIVVTIIQTKSLFK